MKCRYYLSLLSALMLSSCYVNHTGEILNGLQYKASVNSQDAKESKNVLTDGTHFYVELPRYMAEQPTPGGYDLFGLLKEDPKPLPIKTKAKQLVQIPADFAAYLTGRANGPDRPASMTPVEDAAAVRRVAKTRLPIVNKPFSKWTNFDYKAPSKAAIYTKAAINWLIIDLPCTAIGTALYIPFSPIVWLGKNAEPDDETKMLNTIEQATSSIMQEGNEKGYITQDQANRLLVAMRWCAAASENFAENADISDNNAAYHSQRKSLMTTNNREMRAYHGVAGMMESLDKKDYMAKLSRAQKVIETVGPWLEDMVKLGRVR